MIFLEYLRISDTDNTPGGPPGHDPLPRGPHMGPLHLSLHPHTSSSSRKNHQPAQTQVLAHLAAIFDLHAQSSIQKTALGIVPWYVTPQMV